MTAPRPPQRPTPKTQHHTQLVYDPLGWRQGLTRAPELRPVFGDALSTFIFRTTAHLVTRVMRLARARTVVARGGKEYIL